MLKDGKIIEEGSHQELLYKDGQYAKLYKAYYDGLTQKELVYE